MKNCMCHISLLQLIDEIDGINHFFILRVVQDTNIITPPKKCYKWKQHIQDAYIYHNPVIEFLIMILLCLHGFLQNQIKIENDKI